MLIKQRVLNGIAEGRITIGYPYGGGDGNGEGLKLQAEGGEISSPLVPATPPGGVRRGFNNGCH